MREEGKGGREGEVKCERELELREQEIEKGGGKGQREERTHREENYYYV